MDVRRQMTMRVSSGDLSVSEAAREYKVSRNTVRLWVGRAKDNPLVELAEVSRRPHKIPRVTGQEIEQQILKMKAQRPCWGAKKLLATLWPGGSPVGLRTADRILKRHELVTPRKIEPEVQRFEREAPNELWQIDFKGLGRAGPRYSPLTMLDDASRFCLAFDPLETHLATEIMGSLWAAFGTYGLPEAILTDNEPCFAEISRLSLSWLEVQLWLLGIRTLHGRPFHPQTQGKVERFHRTVQLELGGQLLQPDLPTARRIFSLYLDDYNYHRPHEALGMRVPGTVYTPSARARPSKMPEHEIPEGAISRRTCHRGTFSFKGQEYRVGRGLGHQSVVIQEEEAGYAVYFAGRRLANLEAFIS